MAFMANDGKKFTNKPPMMAHERSLRRMGAKSEAGGAGTGLMERRDPLAQPGEGEGEMEPHHEAIQAHLQAMHAETGHGHSQIEHHGDGTHTSHHVSHEGEISGPHHHASDEEMASHMQEHAASMNQGDEPDGDEEGKPEYE